MLAYLARRLTESFFVLAVMSAVIFALIGLMPGDPIDVMIFSDPEMTPADAARLRALYGLDRPITDRYFTWLGSALQGDFGYSRLYNQPTLDILLPRLGNTIVLMGLSFFFALVIALPAGIYAATRPQSLSDHGINLLAFAGISIPPFWLAILLIMLFSVTLGWLPAGGMGEGHSFWSDLRFLVLPVIALTIATVGGVIRFMRAAALETLRQDYVRTARAKGLSGQQIVVGHVLRNAMIPVATILALQMGNLFSGALITETIFAYLGMGKTIYDSIIGNDYNVALVGLLLATVTTLLANLVADLAYTWLDPRISYQ
ncbi:ABC transporter permease [Pelagibius litoralis]|uniref:ABC transporter permease n=1 Tax=Pelagibius litoralis TaxID=374515 RepID=A0A967EZ90_9PROT|nr:ABC transporter permease [Pelagibius litoralis]NIA70166.1 ABC transporter permease [Pelagibius litoralis]